MAGDTSLLTTQDNDLQLFLQVVLSVYKVESMALLNDPAFYLKKEDWTAVPRILYTAAYAKPSFLRNDQMALHWTCEQLHLII